FREELERSPFESARAKPPYADPVTVLQNVRAAFPDARVIALAAPGSGSPTYTVQLQGRGRNFGVSRIAVHAGTGQVLGRFPRRSSPGWIGLFLNLHETLLIGVTGREINGALAALLLVINLTGMVIWWPGIQNWTKALVVDFARGWRRVNFDLHRAVGFWTLAIVSMWAISGVYFGFSRESRQLVEKFSPVVSAMPPSVRVEPQRVSEPADLRVMLAQAEKMEPGARLRSIAFPASRRSPFEIAMQRRGTVGEEFADVLYFDPYDGSYLSTWRRGVNRTLGDWIIWLEIPLHFGTFWGLGVKILWAAMGMAIPLLAVTGLLMYWNRYLRRKIRPRRRIQPAR
ncbi:MAG TPA: PepSY-associated TM helix domain-containing protein, partial [Bryobacteraceae bacterium]|nr:PepSY-associated TM helix domain-containing protein [Bryobacteraceae bacterium]